MAASVKVHFTGFNGGLIIFAHSIAGGNGTGGGASKGSFLEENHAKMVKNLPLICLKAPPGA